ncbi:leucine-rich repeat protein [Thomasclavelia spiroformis]|uniref:leucine-rich repeat protein n=1 Tax=Thomasclavelia spiroformis TaxID=29348 RepID=UPI0026744C0E|nr:leucine-rich repeat protein [Thomasclavelia spiroformis]
MKKLLKILLVLVISLPVIVFGAAENNPVSAIVSGDYAYELIDDNSITIINYDGDEKDLTIPSEIDGKTVKRIGYGAFAECKSIETLVIPDTIVAIGDYAFSQCSQLSEITIPDSVVALGQYSLAGCSSLTSIEIPNGISSISYATFFDCINLTDVVIPEGVKTIGGMVFGNCRALADIDFPTTLTSIGGNAFLNCTGLESITVPEGVITLGSGTFQGCLNLSEINLPNTLVGIGQSAFQDCISLESIVIPESVTGIGYAAFSGCSSLTDVNIPSQVTSIRNATFSGCSSLEELTIPSTITSLGENVFSGCVSLKSMVIPDSVTEIGASTFSNCSNLEEVKLPQNLNRISANLFRYCDSIETVVIPNGVIAVDDTAFADCMNLKSVTFPNTISTSENDGNGIGSRIFSNSPKVVASVIEGSVAHTYMRRNGYDFTLITTGINLDKPELTLNVNESSKYVAILSPYTIANNTSLTWQSSNPEVATVDANGVVTGISEGEATITARNSNGLSASSEVTVTNISAPITNVSLNFSDLEIRKDSSQGLRATITPKETTDDKTLTWESSNPEVATVSSTGVVTARRPGNAIITVRTSNGLTDTCNITVISQITSVHLNLTAITLDEGVSQTLRATINPSDTTDDKTLTWSSSNTNVATVDQEGNVTAVKEGVATITVTTVNGRRAECKITVNKPSENIPIESVSLDKTTLTLEEQEAETLVATINPSDTTDDTTLTWKSNNPEVATVDQEGKVTAIKEGSATITVTTVNGKEATCTVTVTKKPVPIESVSLNKTTLTLEEQQAETLVATINPSDTTDDTTLTWKSNNPEVATVDQEGKVTAIKEGSATITVTTVNVKEATCTVTVLNATALEDAIDRAEAIDESTYTADSYSALQTAIANGKAVLESATATQDDIDLAVEAIETAIDNLVEKASQDLLATLTAKLEECKAMEGNYTSEEFAELKAIIAEVEALLETDPNNIAATDAQAALEKLTEASDALYLSSALKELGITIDEAKEILNGDLSGYTEVSVTALRNTLQTAEDLINAGSKDIELIKQANEDLKAAIDNLTEISSDVNKASLKSAIALGDRMMENIDKYRPATVEGFEELLQRAKDINNSATATQDEINKITEELIIAILDARLDPSK